MIMSNNFAQRLMTAPTDSGLTVARTSVGTASGFRPVTAPASPSVRRAAAPSIRQSITPAPPLGPTTAGTVLPGRLTRPAIATAPLRPVTSTPSSTAPRAEPGREPGLEQVMAYVATAIGEQQAVIDDLIQRQAASTAAIEQVMRIVEAQNNAISDVDRGLKTLAANAEANLARIDEAIRAHGDALTQLASAIAETFTPRRAPGPAERWTKEAKATRGVSKGRAALPPPSEAIVTQAAPEVISHTPQIEPEFSEWADDDDY